MSTLTVIVVVGILLLVAGTTWMQRTYAASPEARHGLASTADVEVQRSSWLVFRPRLSPARAGAVFYPGGKADAVAYAPILQALAARGVLVVLVPMPLNLAILAPGRASEVLDSFPEIRRWTIAGHSLGGAIACQFAHRHAKRLTGLLLWAAYPGKETDLSATKLPILSITGSADELTTLPRLAEAAKRLPPHVRSVELAGANHWTFGHFVDPGSVSETSRDSLQTRIVDLSADFIAGTGSNLPHSS